MTYQGSHLCDVAFSLVCIVFFHLGLLMRLMYFMHATICGVAFLKRKFWLIKQCFCFFGEYSSHGHLTRICKKSRLSSASVSPESSPWYNPWSSPQSSVQVFYCSLLARNWFTSRYSDALCICRSQSIKQFSVQHSYIDLLVLSYIACPCHP